MRGIILAALLLVSFAQANPIKILPLGDSLTAGGYNDESGWHIDGGYREHLHQMLTDAKVEFDFVGRLNHGNFADPQHEGYSGWKIHEVDAITEEAIKLGQPDIIFLIVGGNDLFREHEIKTAHERFGSLVAKIVKLAPNAKVYAGSGLITSSRTLTRRVKKYNKKIKEEVSKLQKDHKNLYWVDMFNESNIQNSKDDLTDGVHPTYMGYRKMAVVWYQNLIKTGVISASGDQTSSQNIPQ